MINEIYTSLTIALATTLFVSGVFFYCLSRDNETPLPLKSGNCSTNTKSKTGSLLRLNESLVLLEESDLSMEEISEKVGYGTLRSFQRQFQAKYDIPPKEYRKVTKERKNEELSNRCLIQQLMQVIRELKVER